MGAAKKKKSAPSLDVVLNIRISPADSVLIARVSKRIPILGKASLVREALRLGLLAIEKNPSVLTEERGPA